MTGTSEGTRGRPGAAATILLAASAAAALAAACSGARHRTGGGGNGGNGGGMDGGGAGGGGAGGGGGGGVPTGCLPGETVCDGPNVRACEGGKPGAVIESCTGADLCSFGRCTSSACADTESKRTFVGCLFYTLDVDNSVHDDDKKLLVLIGNPSDAMPAKVELQTRTAGGPWTAKTTATVMPNGIQTISIADHHHEGGGLGAAMAYRIRSDAPIVAYHVNSDDNDGDSETTGGTMLIPVHVLGRGYMPITYTQKSDTMTDEYGPLASASQVAVVGTVDGTEVTFTAGPKGGTRGEGGVPAKGPGDSFTFTLDDGDTYQIYSGKDGDDLTGSRIDADHAVAVFSGNIGTTYGLGGGGLATGIQSPDMAHEQMIPLTAWGKSYLASRLLPQSACAGTGKPSVSLWRILASEDGTSVMFDAPAGVTGIPAGAMTIDRGAYLEIGVGGPKGNDGDFAVMADKPILVAQFPACEPAMALAVSAEQLLTDFLFITPPIFDHQLAIVRKAGTEVTLDGSKVPDTSFAPAGGGFEVARVNVKKCGGLGGGMSCGHRLRGTEIGVALRGQDTICGYAFSGGMGVRCVNKTAGCR